MRTRIERLRLWLLAGAGLLVVVVAGFIGTARYLRRHWLAAIPQKLGVNVKVDTSGITWSHTYQGQTDVVIHAAKDVEHTDGTFALHDVWMKLCGRQQKRADMVRGDDWEWDQKTGVVRAVGVVHIELRDAAEKQGCSATDDVGPVAAKSGGKTLQATTSNLIYMQKLGVAATSAPIEFASGAVEGHAVGADYASDSGKLMLHSAVSMKGISAGQPVQVEAASAELDGQEHVARLTGARYVGGSGAGRRTALADTAVLHLRSDQTLERIEAQGNVKMEADSGTVSAAKADLAMNAAGHPVTALLTGGVRYAALGPLEERRGEAGAAAITFDGKASPQPDHAVFTGAVHFVDKTRADAAKPAWNTRELTAAKLDVVSAPGASGKNEVRDAEATGSARFTEVNNKGTQDASVGQVTTEIAAENLKAHFADGVTAEVGSRPQLETIAGRGNTLVRQVNAAGVEQTSLGDTLDARFRQVQPLSRTPRAKVSDGNSRSMSADDLVSAVQTGHVVATRKDPGKSAKGSVQQVDVREARAQRASYDGDTDRMTLNGGVQMTDSGSLLRANQVVMEHATGNAQAIGDVKAEYAEAASASGKSSEPMHVLAERADVDHATGVVTFHGAPVKMWQGGSQVQAPVIELGRTPKRLVARGENAAAASGGQVHTLLVNASGAGADPSGTVPVAASARPCPTNASAGKARSGPQQVQSQVVRATSGGLAYSEALHQANFTGGFRAEMADGTVHANAGTVYLKEPKSGAKADALQSAPALAGEVDHVVASGQVALDRPGLRASGERLVYTPSDESLLLTGDAKRPPKALDARGNVATGAALEFHRACGDSDGDTVEVLNTVPGGPLGVPLDGVHTEVLGDAKREQPRR